MDWDRLRIFHMIAEAGSFTSGGEKLGLSQSAASRQIRQLEDSLKVALFTRHARGLVLTAEGEALYATTRDVAQRLGAIEDRLLEARGTPRGRLRIATMVSFGQNWLTPRLTRFVEAYPEVQVELLLTDKAVDLPKRDADVAILFQRPRQLDLIQRPLLDVNHHIYAAPAYLDRFGTPHTAEDLDRHRIITYGPQTPDAIRDINWTLTIGRSGAPRQPIFKVSNTYAVMRAIEQGLGLAAIPDYLVEPGSPLVRVLPEIERPAFHTHLVYPQELRGTRRVELLRDFLVDAAKRA
ncbi:MAG: LysR family transcriptional regulator [Rhodothalassiaceae bacterium]